VTSATFPSSLSPVNPAGRSAVTSLARSELMDRGPSVDTDMAHPRPCHVTGVNYHNFSGNILLVLNCRYRLRAGPMRWPAGRVPSKRTAGWENDPDEVHDQAQPAGRPRQYFHARRHLAIPGNHPSLATPRTERPTARPERRFYLWGPYQERPHSATADVLYLARGRLVLRRLTPATAATG
jgi:hypothetical protein